ncbi:Alpha/Beta hydrolase protein [Boletus edulis]|uniref:Alpha beta-hydrolase n=1 Tax=Boletus edulis BED1 TaxID=1328754 RepID=A0AAD4GFJ6_BOLED|nr:Alpha/Beta hydrolase protein [Boletus edulis]KAF8441481.1 alpha beta-hydrolase [Boletus edulis BED1]
MALPLSFTTQPWKGLYLGYGFSTTLLQVPLWTLRYMLPSARPFPSWSLGHTIAVQLSRCVAHISSITGGIVGLPTHRATLPTPDAEAVWIDGTPHLVTAELETWAYVAKVEPERIPGYWYGRNDGSKKPTTPIPPGQRVFYFLHGGGYIQLSAHPNDMTSNITRALVELDDSAPHALSLEYRLSATVPLPDQNPFPAALLDALAGYNYLVDVMGYSPSNVVVVGDSAGGNLALALTRYLVENRNTSQVSLPAPPGHLILLSPWTDLSTSHDWLGSSTHSNTADYLGFHNSGRSLYSKYAFLGPFGLGFAFHNRYISPACLHLSDYQAHFGGFPRTFIATGTAERMYDATRTLGKKMTAEMGEGDGEGQVMCFEGQDAVHDFLVFVWHPCRTAALLAIQQWLAAA